MSKQDMLKIQSCVLKVNIHCDGCEHKVKKLLQKIDGVYSVNIDAEQGKAVVSGNVDPAKLIKKLKSSGKHAELLGGQRGMMLPTNQFKKLQIDQHGHGKGGKDNKSQKGGGGGGQHQPQPQLSQFQNKGAKDLKFPSKDQKSVKFNLPEKDESEDEFDDSDEFDDDDYDEEEDEEDFGHHGHGHGHGHGMPTKMMPMMKDARGPHGPAITNNKGGGKKGDLNLMDLAAMQMQFKGKAGNNNNNNEFKNGDGGKKNNNKGDGGKKNKGGGGGESGDKKKNSKSSGGTGLLGRFLGFGQKSSKGSDKSKNKNNNGGGGGGGGKNNKGKEGKKGGGKSEGHDKLDDEYDDEFDDGDFSDNLDDEFESPPHHHGKGGKGGKASGNGNGKGVGPSPMGHNQMGSMEQLRNLQAVQGLPAPATMNGGYYNQGIHQMQQPHHHQQQHLPPQYNPQQQQYMAMMMNNHNQQPHMNSNMYPPVMYGRPYMPPPPPLPIHPAADPITHVFSDENTESCTIM